MGGKNVGIVGGGFAGLSAARVLRSALVNVTVVDRRNYHLFQNRYLLAFTAVAVWPCAPIGAERFRLRRRA